MGEFDITVKSENTKLDTETVQAIQDLLNEDKSNSDTPKRNTHLMNLIMIKLELI